MQSQLSNIKKLTNKKKQPSISVEDLDQFSLTDTFQISQSVEISSSINKCVNKIGE